MVDGVYRPVSRSSAIANEPQIKRTRKILAIILGVFVVSSRQAGALLVCSNFEAFDFVSSRRWV